MLTQIIAKIMILVFATGLAVLVIGWQEGKFSRKKQQRLRVANRRNQKWLELARESREAEIAYYDYFDSLNPDPTILMKLRRDYKKAFKRWIGFPTDWAIAARS